MGLREDEPNGTERGEPRVPVLPPRFSHSWRNLAEPVANIADVGAGIVHGSICLVDFSCNVAERWVFGDTAAEEEKPSKEMPRGSRSGP